MYGINLLRAGDQQTIQFGLKKSLPFRDLHDAYRLVLGDISSAYGNALTIEYASDPAWGPLTLGDGADLELELRADGEEWILYVKDRENGGSTSTGVKSIEEAFDFMAYWADESLRTVDEWDQ